jgi:hypothetical protein
MRLYIGLLLVFYSIQISPDATFFWLWQDEELASVAGKQFVALNNPYGDVGYGPIRVSFLLIYFSCIYVNKSMSGPIQTFYETNNVFILSQ